MEPLQLPRSSLLVTDVQCCFSALAPQELPVPNALDIVGNVNRLLDLRWRRIDASQDWHPIDHCSFVGQRDALYPPHCVAGTPAAEFLPGVHAERFHTIWRKGYETERDTYSLVEQHPGFVALLRATEIGTVVICGLATNICCFHVARDLRAAGFRVILVEDASAGIDVPAAGLMQDKAKADGQRLGIEYRSTDEVMSAVQS